MDSDIADELVEQVARAHTERNALRIAAGGSKSFYGHDVDGEKLDVSGHSGIIDYRASELVITARSGTKLTDVEAALDEQGQQLAFEPPRHNEDATIGGAVACGMSGPGRPFYGAARDFVLGARIINGRGELMQFGGQVMKNVAGYDLSRLMVGAQGTLGIIIEVSVKVLPRAETESTLAFETNAADGHRMLRDWLGAGHPITASCHYQGVLSVRLSSTGSSVGDAARKLGGEAVSNQLWQQLRDQSHPCFRQESLWRLSLPPAAAVDTEVEQLIEWGGALRWQVADSDLFESAQRLGGHATRYRMTPDHPENIFQPLQPGMLAIQKRIKHALDPANILNPGRLYPEL